MKLLVPLLLFVLTTGVVSAHTSLGNSLKIGGVFTFRQNADQIITQDLDGTSHKITNSSNGFLNFEVVDKQEKNYEIEPMSKDLNLKMTSSIQSELMKKSLEKEFGSKALSESYEQMTFIYPTSEGNIGDTWGNEYTGKFNVKNTWTLNKLAETNTTIRGTGEVEIDIAAPNTTMKLTGSQTTEVSTDIVSGLILKKKVEGISPDASTLVQLGKQEIPTTIISTITYELIQ